MDQDEKLHLHRNRGLSFAELGALLGTRALIAEGYMEHSRDTRNIPGDQHIINMSISCNVEGCGSIGCIGGTMAMIMGMRATQAAQYVHNQGLAVGPYNHRDPDRDPLRNLFFPPREYEYRTITPKQMVAAIDNFINTGNADWETILVGNERAL